MNYIRRGFTLIEILIVIVIISVMAGVVIPAYLRYLDHVHFSQKTHEVQDLFAYAREQAVALDAMVTLHFDPQSETFEVQVPPPLPLIDLPVAASTPDQPDATSAQAAPIPRTVQLNQDQKVQQYTVTPASQNQNVSQTTNASGQNDLHFLSDGTVEALDMVLSQADGIQAHLMLAPATGRLSLDRAPTQ